MFFVAAFISFFTEDKPTADKKGIPPYLNYFYVCLQILLTKLIFSIASQFFGDTCLVYTEGRKFGSG